MSRKHVAYFEAVAHTRDDDARRVPAEDLPAPMVSDILRAPKREPADRLGTPPEE
jgi:hypothetical protein